MFTGLVERTGRVISLTAPESPKGGLMPSITQLIIDVGKDFDTKIGDSIAVNGCCLTVTSNRMMMLAFDLNTETIQRTALHQLREGHEVNLERAMRLGDRLGGHLVSGHVDGVGMVERIQKLEGGWDLTLALPRELGRYVVPKGSVCVDGISLTVNSLHDIEGRTLVRLMLIPTTVSLTAIRHVSEGGAVNIEVDMIGKYIERLTFPHTPGF